MLIPTLSPNTDPVLRKMDRLIEWFLLAIFLCVTLLVCCSCGSTKMVTQTVRDVQKDTVYLSNIQYDSIYIYKEVDKDFHRAFPNPSTLNPNPSTDTLYIKDVSVEYRYKLLRDTVRIVQRDSIPYEVTVTEVKEITRPLTWFDKASGFCILLVIVIAIVIVAKPTIRLILKLRKL